MDQRLGKGLMGSLTDLKACPFIVPALIVQDGMYVFGGMVDSLHHVTVTPSLRFEGELFMVELALGLYRDLDRLRIKKV